jgi:hypothetical protein
MFHNTAKLIDKSSVVELTDDDFVDCVADACVVLVASRLAA